MITPNVFSAPSSSAQRDRKFSTIGFLPNTPGDATTLNRSLPFTLVNAGDSWTSDVIYVAGFRSFQTALQVSAGKVELHFLLLHPLSQATISDDLFAMYDSTAGHLAISWAALANNGGGGGGPLLTGGLDGRIYTHMKLQLKANVATTTVSALDGLWCAST